MLNIVIFGNINNYPLLLAEGLRELGHQVKLLVNRKEILHRPEARHPEMAQAYPDWILDCSDITDEDIAYETPAIDTIVRNLTHKKTDLAILNDSGPAFAGCVRADYAVLLTGSDLDYYANFDSLRIRSQTWDPEYKRSLEGRRYLRKMADFVARQRDGILAANVVCYAQKGLIPAGDRLLDDIGVADHRRLMIALSNTLQLHAQVPKRNRQLQIFSGARVIYRPEHRAYLSPLDFKGTDLLLEGFAEYCKRGGSGQLHLPLKGRDVDEAKKLIDRLGIKARVKWKTETPVSQFYRDLADADVVCDQFGSAFPGLVATDAFALGRPVLANLRNDIFSQRFPEPLPGLNATTPQEIAEQLLTAENDRDLLEAIGRQSRAYAEKYLSPTVMAQDLLAKLVH